MYIWLTCKGIWVLTVWYGAFLHEQQPKDKNENEISFKWLVSKGPNYTFSQTHTRAWYLWNYGSLSDFTLQVRNRKMWSWFNLHIHSPPGWRMVCALFQRASRKNYRFLLLLVRTVTSTWLKKKKQKAWSARGADRSAPGTSPVWMAPGLFWFSVIGGFQAMQGWRAAVKLSMGTCWYWLFLQQTKLSHDNSRLIRFKKKPLKLQLVLRRNREINAHNRLGICWFW